MHEGTIPFSALAAFAISLTGFTGLIASLRRKPIGEWHARVRFNFWITLAHGASSFLLALAPSLLRDLGVTAWWPAHLLWLALALAVATTAIRFNRRLRREGSPATVLSTWWISWLLATAAIIVLIASLFGAFGGPSEATYHFGVTTWVLLGLISFIATLLYPLD